MRGVVVYTAAALPILRGRAALRPPAGWRGAPVGKRGYDARRRRAAAARHKATAGAAWLKAAARRRRAAAAPQGHAWRPLG